MRNKRETDISQYRDKPSGTITEVPNDSVAKQFFKGFGKVVLTAASVFMVALLIVGIFLSIYIFTLSSEPTGIDLKAKSLNQTSFIMVQNKETGEFEEYKQLYSTENRIWVNNQDIPQSMKDAIVAIEDKRFFDHKGVDWVRTSSAVLSLVTGSQTYGGSTLTQQLIKNITDDNEVSLTRKLREICKALKLENEYTKDQILEAYLNVVNFGNNCQGVEAAAQLYFDKSITDCTTAECAAIAGITQNPSQWNPLIYPENNKERREIVLDAMHDQGKINDEEYNQAMQESEKMTFVGFKTDDDDDDDDDDGYVQNWYLDELQFDLQKDLAELYGISEEAASDKIFTEGLKIYCAMDLDLQEYIEKEAQNIDKSNDDGLQIGSTVMGFDGRVIATVGSSNKKTQALEWDRATMSTLQPGSTIKPVIVYPLAIENKQLYFSSTVLDEPIENYRYDEQKGTLVDGPDNAYEYYKGNMLLPEALLWSSNATAAQTMKMVGPENAYEQAVTKMGFSSLSEEDINNTGALSIGGMNGGVSVREMAAAYTYMGNGGLYYKPYTYYYVTDSEDNIIIDNRNQVPKSAYTAETAGIMNRLLHYNMVNTAGETSAQYARVSGWDIVGKTGSTDDYKDSWYCGVSPYAVMASWCGFDNPDTVSPSGRTVAAKFFANVMGKYLEGQKQKDYTLPPNLIAAEYNPYTGLIVTTDNPSGKYVGYYTEDNMPSYGGAYSYDDQSEESGESNSDEGNSDTSNSESNDDKKKPDENSGDSSSKNEHHSSSSENSDGGGEQSKPDEGNQDDESQRSDE